MTDQENKDLGTSEQEHSGIAESPARGGAGGRAKACSLDAGGWAGLAELSPVQGQL